MEKSKSSFNLFLTIAFFIVVIVDLYGEYTNNINIVYGAKPFITILIIVMYWFRSSVRDGIFIWSLFFCLASSVLFIPDNADTLLWGVTIFAVHRLFLIAFLGNLLHHKNFLSIGIAMLPILFIFFYLVYINVDLNYISLLVFSINNILLSLFGGIIIANYMMKNENNNTWLLISALMFIALQMIVYIEKFYLIEFSPRILRPTAIVFFSSALFTLLRGVVSQERLNRDASAGSR